MGTTPAQINREWGGVGSSVKACSVYYWHALPPCCQLPANGHLTAAMTHIAAVNTHTTDISQRRGGHSLHVNNYMQQMITDVEKCFVSSLKGRGASDLNCCTRLLKLAPLLRNTDCNNVKGREKLTLYKEYKKVLTNYRLYSTRIHCTQHIWL